MRRALEQTGRVIGRAPRGVAFDVLAIGACLAALGFYGLGLLVLPRAVTCLYHRARRASGAADAELDPDLDWFFEGPGAYLVALGALHRVPILLIAVYGIGLSIAESSFPLPGLGYVLAMTSVGAIVGAPLGLWCFELAAVPRLRRLRLWEIAGRSLARAQAAGWQPALERGALLGGMLGLVDGLFAAAFHRTVASHLTDKAEWLAFVVFVVAAPFVAAVPLALATVFLAVAGADAESPEEPPPDRARLRRATRRAWVVALVGALAALGMTYAATLRLPRMERFYHEGWPTSGSPCEAFRAPEGQCVWGGPRDDGWVVVPLDGTPNELAFRPPPKYEFGWEDWTIDRLELRRADERWPLAYTSSILPDSEVGLSVRPLPLGWRGPPGAVEVIVHGRYGHQYDARRIVLDEQLRVPGDEPIARIQTVFDDFGVTLLVMPLAFLLAALLTFLWRRVSATRLAVPCWDDPGRGERVALEGQLRLADDASPRSVAGGRMHFDGAASVEGPPGSRSLRLPSTPVRVVGARSGLVDGANIEVVGRLGASAEGGFRDGASAWPADAVLVVGRRGDAARALADNAAMRLSAALMSVGAVWLFAAGWGLFSMWSG